MRTGYPQLMKVDCLGCGDCLDGVNLASKETAEINIPLQYPRRFVQTAWSILSPRRALIAIAAVDVRIIVV